MKNFKTALALIAAALLALALFASPSSGISLANATPTGDNDGANLEPRPATGPYTTGHQMEFLANFPTGSANRLVTLYMEGPDNTWTTVVGTDGANHLGNAYIDYTILAGAKRFFAEDSSGLQTEIRTITGVDGPPPPEPGTAILNPSADAKTWTATFTPGSSGAATRLEAREICTYETDETNPETGPFDDSVSQKDCKGPWKTRDTGTQTSSGDTTFVIANPLEVKHVYRAVSGSTISNEVKNCTGAAGGVQDPNVVGSGCAAPLKTTPDTGLSRLHFNTYEGDSVNTRARWFEGEFSMTGSTKIPACTAFSGQMKSRMKGRGNYSWSFEKKSFSMNTDKKSNLCGLGVGKKWALVANHYDKSLLRNSLAGYIGSKFTNLAWTPKSAPVDLFVNGSYQGSYLLIERINIQGSVENNLEDPPNTYSDRVNIHELQGDDPDEQVDPGKTGGYIVEWDFRAADNSSSAPDTYMNIGTRGLLGIKSPEFEYTREGVKTDEGISSAQKNSITNYIDSCDTKLFSSNFTSDGAGGWKSCIDQDSAVDYYLAMEYLKPVDGNMWASVYMYKPREGKLHLGPLWDFDLAVGSANRAGNVVSSSSWYLKNNLGVSAQQSSKTWFNRLNEDPDFRDAVNARWNQVNGTLSPGTFLDTQKSILASSASANYSKWGYKCNISSYQVCKGSFSADVSYVRSWANTRKGWIDGQIPGS